jgi:hypothetical protein
MSEFVVLMNIVYLLSHMVQLGQFTMDIVLEQFNFEIIAQQDDPENILLQIREKKRIAYEERVKQMTQ